MTRARLGYILLTDRDRGVTWLGSVMPFHFIRSAIGRLWNLETVMRVSPLLRTWNLSCTSSFLPQDQYLMVSSVPTDMMRFESNATAITCV